MLPRCARLAFVASLAAASLLPRSAAGFVCSRVTDQPGDPECPPPDPDPYGPSLSWDHRNLSYQLFAAGTADMPADEELALLRLAFLPWEGVQECAPPHRTLDVSFVEGALSNTDVVGFNHLAPDSNENLLIFRDDLWPHPGGPPFAIALTTTTYVFLTGEIIDADIEFNSARFDFKDCAQEACDTDDADLLNTAVHEIGHFLGLSHSATRDSTMFAEAAPGETLKRDLSCDDRDGIVFKYPRAEANGYCDAWNAYCGCCAPPNELSAFARLRVDDVDDGLGGCDCHSSGSTAPAGLPLLWLLWLRWRRRSVERVG